MEGVLWVRGGRIEWGGRGGRGGGRGCVWDVYGMSAGICRDAKRGRHLVLVGAD